MIINKKIGTIVFVLFLVGLGGSAKASLVEDYAVELKVNDDMSIFVRETAQIDFENNGIVETQWLIPSYIIKGDRKVKLKIYDISAKTEDGTELKLEKEADDRQSENKVKESLVGYESIKISGFDAKQSGRSNLLVEYKVKGALQKINNDFMLDWATSGGLQGMQVEQSKISIGFPNPAQNENVETECFAGEKERVRNCVSERREFNNEEAISGIVFSHDRLMPREQILISAKIPAESVHFKGFWRRFLEIIARYWLGLLLGLVIMVFFSYRYRRNFEAKKKK